MADDIPATDNTSAEATATTDSVTSDQATQDPAPAVADAPAAVVGAPETYEAFTLPEDVQLDDGIMSEFSQLAKGANLPQDKAQTLVELGVKMAKGFESSTQQSLDSLKTQFATDLANDKTLGGEQLDANIAIAQRAINAYGSDELKTMLDASGLGRHPELVRFFHAVGQTVSEDSNVDSNPSTGGQKSLAERMYGTEEATA